MHEKVCTFLPVFVVSAAGSVDVVVVSVDVVVAIDVIVVVGCTSIINWYEIIMSHWRGMILVKQESMSP